MASLLILNQHTFEGEKDISLVFKANLQCHYR